MDVGNSDALDEASPATDAPLPSLRSCAEEQRLDSNFGDLVGQSAALRYVLKLVSVVAPTDSSVLLLGETGSGKELVARALHNCSRRRNQTLVKVNCAAIPSGLLESELFGHERGAFTGAVAQKIGRIELADQGSLFLDEIGDLPLELQPKLLRVLQEREFERLGSVRTKKVHVRVIAAAHRSLEEMVAQNQFRGDLYYRLNVFPIVIPPLRERPEDIPSLVRHFATQFAQRMNKRVPEISLDALATLTGYAWPGNIRELQNVMERAVVLHEAGKLSVQKGWFAREPRPNEWLTQIPGSKPKTTDRDVIGAALAETKGRVSGPRGAAVKLGMPASTLESKIKSLHINKHGFKTSALERSLSLARTNGFANS
jgi:formate hydrogenlyase transcriptional activator